MKHKRRYAKILAALISVVMMFSTTGFSAFATAMETESLAGKTKESSTMATSSDAASEERGSETEVTDSGDSAGDLTGIINDLRKILWL